MVVEALNKLSERNSLTKDETAEFINQIASDSVTDAQIAAFLMGLRTKGETTAEVAGCVDSLRGHATPVPHKLEHVYDCCGTGGDGKSTFNISTAASLVTAACGMPTAKHGNRAVSSKCGSADLLEAAGVNLEMSPSDSAQMLEKIGYCFLFAPGYHPATKRVAQVRRQLGVRTVFNLIGPLLNPARATIQLVGVPGLEIARLLASVGEYVEGLKVTTVFNSLGYDELLPMGTNHTFSFDGNEIRQDSINLPKQLENGFKPDHVTGGNKEDNLSILKAVLEGKDSAYLVATALNAAMGLVISGLASGLEEGYLKSEEALKQGRVKKLLQDVVEYSQEAK